MYYTYPSGHHHNLLHTSAKTKLKTVYQLGLWKVTPGKPPCVGNLEGYKTDIMGSCLKMGLSSALQNNFNHISVEAEGWNLTK